ncbi:MAG: Cys-tRNA(Pro) deacylase [Erysipelotrichaceae bacterium]|nr:Cys-tRNA(Pro) deacylase [Erysipelotrichaceae bacterium]
MKEVKTNAMRILDKAGITYKTLTYDLGDERFSGEKVTELLGLDSSACYKTLALKHEHDLFVLVIPVSKTIDLKKAAAALGVKNLTMVAVKDLLKTVGYERGSVSPVGIRAKHRLVFDQEVMNHEEIEISGGKLGIGLSVNREALLKYLEGEVKDLCV